MAGKYLFNRMICGLRNAPASFQMLMHEALGDLVWSVVIVFVNDLIVYSPDFETHLEHIQAVMDRLKRAGLTIHPGKAEFNKQ